MPKKRVLLLFMMAQLVGLGWFYFIQLDRAQRDLTSEYALFKGLSAYYSLLRYVPTPGLQVQGPAKFQYCCRGLPGLKGEPGVYLSLDQPESWWAQPAVTLSFLLQTDRLDPLAKDHYAGGFWAGEPKSGRDWLSLYVNTKERFYHLKTPGQAFNSSYDRLFDRHAHLLTLVMEPGRLRLWDNRQLVLDQPVTRVAWEPNGVFWFSRGLKPPQPLDGTFSHLALWTRALGEEEVQALVKLHQTQPANRLLALTFQWADFWGADLFQPFDFWWFYEIFILPLAGLAGWLWGRPFWRRPQ
ncbi:MAG: hypothetical protein A2527_12865 [Candidatus Lambdaproteobacteria bacterium RIFOXYD2_FULL_50_16]|uniref:Uncharacterized protein n=1 Tax=Candidatus Lambdaproteobacteria bacterium RIFOXYD2_FULL_50_16 TaxID=1817772 RepID=A0A1F6G9Q7_9PROT|nr:MAG: hypothetical protein A2527_12865 [Candidatus Lambdaproteobacteria bacterium RIFOXYD2_FULL_50_16]